MLSEDSLGYRILDFWTLFGIFRQFYVQHLRLSIII